MLFKLRRQVDHFPREGTLLFARKRSASQEEEASHERQKALDEAAANHDVNRHRSLEDALRAILDHERFPLEPVDRFEVGFQASGEVAVRWRPLGTEETEGFVLAPA